MASLFKSIFKSKKEKENKNFQLDNHDIQRESRRSRKSSYGEIHRNLSPTAPYHSSTLRRIHYGPRSCPGEFSRNFDRYTDNRSVDSEFRPSREHRGRMNRRHSRKRYTTCGSDENSSENHYAAYNPNLEDSDSDTWFVDEENLIRVKELESRLSENKSKLKEFKERLRSERDLRISNERNMIEEIERLKRENKKEQRLRKTNDQKYASIIEHLQERLNHVEIVSSAGVSMMKQPYNRATTNIMHFNTDHVPLAVPNNHAITNGSCAPGLADHQMDHYRSHYDRKDNGQDDKNASSHRPNATQHNALHSQIPTSSSTVNALVLNQVSPTSQQVCTNVDHPTHSKDVMNSSSQIRNQGLFSALSGVSPKELKHRINQLKLTDYDQPRVFRDGEAYDIEVARDDNHSSFSSIAVDLNVSSPILRVGDSDNGYETTAEHCEQK